MAATQTQLGETKQMKHFFACLLTLTIAAAAHAQKPNILFIFADDHTWEALGCMGSEVQTPNLDRLADQGVLFPNTYNMGSWTGAVCIASRTMLNTGHSLWHSATLDQAAKKKQKEKQPITNAGTAWSQWLADAGYHTYFTGKWHVRLHQVNNVFHESGTERPGMPKQTEAGYNRPVSSKDKTWQPWDTNHGGFWEGGTHWSEVLRHEAVDFLQSAKTLDKPFFAYLAFNAPHDPRQAPKSDVDRYPVDSLQLPDNFLPEYPYGEQIASGRKVRDERLAPFPRTPHAVKVNRQEYFALITHMDTQIGHILDALQVSGKADNTYIFFTADHGLAVGQHGLLGKQNMYEHSLKAPLIVAGPGVPKGKRVHDRVYLQDVVPTTLDLAEAPVPDQVAFKSFLPLLQGQAYNGHDAIYGAYRNTQRAVVQGDWKLIYYPAVPKHRLFNLANDPHEKHDLADDPSHAEQLSLMKQRLEIQMKRYDDPLISR